jgi:hypothetical protein
MLYGVGVGAGIDDPAMKLAFTTELSLAPMSSGELDWTVPRLR